MNQRIFLSSPHMSGREQKYIDEAFITNWISPLGPNVDAFEKELAVKVGSSGAAALSSGTAAIHLALRYIGVKTNDRVFCSSLTFAASVNPVLYQGGEPVFIDSEPETWNMSPKALEKAFSESYKKKKMPKAVIAVNLYGQSADYDSIMEICQRYGVPVIEDAAESLGATYKGKNSGTIGNFGIYSFNGNKIITTSGGGALVSDDLEALKKVRFWATQARDSAPHYQHSDYGYNYRMSNILAGIGRGQLEVLDDRIEARRGVFKRYASVFTGIEGIEMMPQADFGISNCWLSVMTVEPQKCGTDNKKIAEALAKENIESRPVWKPMHLQPLFKGCKYYTHEEERSVSDDLFALGICLPSGSNLSESNQDRVIDIIKDCISR